MIIAKIVKKMYAFNAGISFDLTTFSSKLIIEPIIKNVANALKSA
jgi:hypothetical protein